MIVSQATQQDSWDAFLQNRPFSPFLQSWTMGNVYEDIGEKPIRLVVTHDEKVVGICQAIVVPARRGRHLAVLYGPVLKQMDALCPLLNELRRIAKDENCSFIRLSPFWPTDEAPSIPQSKTSPLHLLGEHVWHIPLLQGVQWADKKENDDAANPRTEEEIQKDMRKTTRNLIRRARKEGVTITASDNPQKDIEHFLTLHEETRKRHHFTPYKNSFFRAQVERFSQREECTLYLAHYNNEVIASSIHMHFGGETSYHHGASTKLFSKIPASYLLQWTAITDALARKDRVYSFWGIAPEGVKKHPFAGVTTFKRGFGGELLELVHCRDVPLNVSYRLTRTLEQVRKWKRGF